MKVRPAALLVVACLGVGTNSISNAATIVVNSTADDFDLGPNGNCTLREAVLAANTNAAVDTCPAGESGPAVVDRIEVPSGTYNLTVGSSGEDSGEGGDLDLTDEVEIEGAGPRTTVVDAGGADRVLEVHSGVEADVGGLTLSGGDAQGGAGGGVRNGGDLDLFTCRLTNNHANGPGGAIRNDGDLMVLGCTVDGNTTDDHGGGLDNHGTGTIVISTFTGNTVNGGGSGGGLYNLGGEQMTVINSTVAGNNASSGDAIHVAGTVNVGNVLIVGACDAAVSSTLGGNLESPGDTCGLGPSPDQVGVADPMLGALADNGGPTDTMLPLAGSAAIDQGSDPACTTVDQHGAARPFDGDGNGTATCDVGAVEAGSPIPVFTDGFESSDTSSWSSTVP